MEIKDRIINYWTNRSHDFAKLRYEELHSYMAKLWLNEIKTYLPKTHITSKNEFKILDIGTGSGFFALLLAKEGYCLTGIDITQSMIDEAIASAKQHDLIIDFQVMDAENLSFEDNTFDMIISRNLTWTLPNPQKAYTEWHRVLKPEGILLNFDADYGNEQFAQDLNKLPKNHAHQQVQTNLMQECDLIKNTLDISKTSRPQWDIEVLQQLKFTSVSVDLHIKERIYHHLDKFYNPAPVFLITAHK